MPSPPPPPPLPCSRPDHLPRPKSRLEDERFTASDRLPLRTASRMLLMLLLRTSLVEQKYGA